MTSPATFNTPGRIITFAMQDAGLLEEGAEPNSEQLANNLVRLNDLVNLWQTQGLKLFLLADQLVTLVAGQATYTLTPGGHVNITKPLRVLQGYYLDSSSNRRPIWPISWDEYLRLSNVSQQGAINSYFVDKQETQLSISFWLTPDTQAATGTAHLLLQQQVTNLVGLNDTMGFPQEWFLALRWGLADDICTGQPQAIMDRCALRANAFRAALEDWDVEDASTQFQPDSRLLNQTGAFR